MELGYVAILKEKYDVQKFITDKYIKYIEEKQKHPDYLYMHNIDLEMLFLEVILLYKGKLYKEGEDAYFMGSKIICDRSIPIGVFIFSESKKCDVCLSVDKDDKILWKMLHSRINK